MPAGDETAAKLRQSCAQLRAEIADIKRKKARGAAPKPPLSMTHAARIPQAVLLGMHLQPTSAFAAFRGDPRLPTVAEREQHARAEIQSLQRAFE